MSRDNSQSLFAGVARGLALTTLTAGALGAGLAIGAFAEAHAYLLRHVEVPLLESGELRVLHISDLHAMPNQQRKFRFLAGLADLEPDLVISTGDNISHPDAIEPLLVALSPLLELPGAFVLGSNDKFAPVFRNPVSYLAGNSTPRPDPTRLPTARLVDAFTAGGWADLNNHRTRLQASGLDIELRGTDDAHHGFADYAAVAGPADPSVDLRLGVTHAPYQWLLDAMHEDGVDMIFAGHTHGGQVCLPVNRALITNCDLPRELASGLSHWPSEQRLVGDASDASGRTALHVSAGLGTSPFAPIRLFCRPEVSLLRLVAR